MYLTQIEIKTQILCIVGLTLRDRQSSLELGHKKIYKNRQTEVLEKQTLLMRFGIIIYCQDGQGSELEPEVKCITRSADFY